jgi:hypothetical protein
MQHVKSGETRRCGQDGTIQEHTIMKRKFRLTLLTALLLAPLAALPANRTLPEVPNFGKLRVGSFQPLENRGAMTSKDWN